MTIDNVPMLEVPEEELKREPVLLKGRVDCHIDFEIDVSFLRKKMGEEAWKKYKLAKGWQEWERGAVIAWNTINDSVALDLLAEVNDCVKVKRAAVDDIDFSPRWSKELAEQLDFIPKRRCRNCGKSGQLIYCSIACHKADRPELW